MTHSSSSIRFLLRSLSLAATAILVVFAWRSAALAPRASRVATASPSLVNPVRGDARPAAACCSDAPALFRSLSPPFIENRGQWQSPAAFVTRRGGQVASFERDAIAIRLVAAAGTAEARGAVLRLEIEDVDPLATIVGVDPRPGVRNYFLGDDSASWRTGVLAYSSVEFRQVRPGVDVYVHDGSGASACDLEYDVVLAPHSDLDSLALRCRGAGSLALRDDGALLLDTPVGVVVQSAPSTWQLRSDGTRVPVSCRFRLLGSDRFGFEVDGRDDSLALCIDPGLDWSTFIGGSQDDALRSVFVDPAGFLDMAGTTSSNDFPTTSGTFNPLFHGPTDAVVCRFDPTQSGAAQLLWATYLGGTGDENGRELFVDAAGVVTLAGDTTSSSFPTTKGAYDRFYNGAGDLFATRLDPSLAGTAQLVWSTFLGGSGKDQGTVAFRGVDSTGVVTLFGTTASNDFPTTAGCYSPNAIGGTDVFVARLDPSKAGAAQLLYSSYLGGTSDDEALSAEMDGAGRVTLGGHTSSSDLPTTAGAYATSVAGAADAFVARIDLGGNGAADLLYSTYFGGTSDEAANSVALDAAGKICFAGFTTSPDLPTTSGAYDTSFNGGGRPNEDAFLARLDPGGNGSADLLYSTFLGGSADQDVITSIAVGASGEVTAVGTTWSSDFPTTFSAYMGVYVSAGDGFVTKFRPDGNGAADVTYSTYLGASADDLPATSRGVAVDANDFPTLVGTTRSSNYPTTANAFSNVKQPNYDAYATRLALASWRSYGVGYAGTLGAPVLAPRANPVINHNFALDLSNSRGVSTSGLVFAGIADANTPTTAGGTLLVTPIVAIPLAVPASGASLSGSVPNDPTLAGTSLFFQGIEADAGAPHGISFSAGVRVVLGF
jgi:hypothetical protein